MLLLAIVSLILLIPSVALAATAAIPFAPGIEEIAKVVFDAVQGGSWRLAAVAGVILVTQAAKYFWPKFAEGKTAWATAIVLGVAGAVANAWLAGVVVVGVSGYLALVVSGAINGLAAAGLYRGHQKLSEKKE